MKLKEFFYRIRKQITQPIFDLYKIRTKYKFEIIDSSKQKNHSKNFTANWNRELFKRHIINNTSPVTYNLKDENKETIQGKYFEQKLLRPAFNFKSISNTLEMTEFFFH